MEKKIFTVRKRDIEQFEEYLRERENAAATIEKYMRDIRTFRQFAGSRAQVDKEELLRYKAWLMEHYSASSVNSMLAALNQFLVFIGAGRLRLKRIKIQKQNVHPGEKQLEREEFRKLVRTARAHRQEQTALLMETMGATGVRVSELKYFRVEDVRKGMVRVWNKGKYRIVLIPALLRNRLLAYAAKAGLCSGLIFRTRTGQAKDRSNIWKDMKRIAVRAGIAPEKVFPHNLRHLFARTFYRETKNLLNLADILGHSSLGTTRLYASNGMDEWKRNLEKIKLLDCTT